MKIILDAIEEILAKGVKRDNRTGIGTIQIPNLNLSWDLRKGDPILTTRKQKWENVFHELKWFISGTTNISYLKENNCPFWNEWAIEQDVIFDNYVSKQLLHNFFYDYLINFYKPGNMSLNDFFRTIFDSVKNNCWSLHPDLQIHLSNIIFNLLTSFDIKDVDAAKYVGVKVEDILEDFPDAKAKLEALTNSVILKSGSVGNMYGFNLIHFNGTTNQLESVISSLRNRPLSRRHIITFLNPDDFPNERISPKLNVINGYSALAPCHFAVEFMVEPIPDSELTVNMIQKGIKYYIDTKFHMRSSDVVLGLPANILSYSMLLKMIAQQVDMVPRTVYYTGSNVHIYENHLEGIKEWLSRTPADITPTLNLINKPRSIYDYEISDWELLNYNPQPLIKFQVAV